MSTVTIDEHRAAPRVNQPTTAAAALTAMGIVYGDLGTSRLLKFGFSQLYPAFETGSVVLVECH
jgi:K+ transporter